jgi:hypothetical protein
MPKKELTDLERIVKAVPALRTALDATKIDNQFNTFATDLETYILQQEDLQKDAAAKGIAPEQLSEYVRTLSRGRYELLYKADKVLGALEDTISSMGTKNKLLQVAMRFGKSKILMPAYLATYVAREFLYSTVGQYQLYSSRGWEGSLPGAMDRLGRQGEAVADILVFPGLKLMDLERRIKQAAIYDVKHWIKTGQPSEPADMRIAQEVWRKVKYAAGKVADAFDYHPDLRPAAESGYALVQAQ